MAQRLEIQNLPSTVGRPQKYPWSDWSDGTAWRIVEGEDYEREQTMKNVLRVYASAHGYYVTVAVNEPGTIDFQFTKKNSFRSDLMN